MILCGIDPGANGAISVFDGNNIYFRDYKTKGLYSYIEILKEYPPDLCSVEKVHAMPGQGVSSTFSFGQRLGEIEGMLMTLNVPYQLVLPRVWQKSLGLNPKATKKDIASVLLKMYPQAELYGSRGGLADGRSDALGLLHYTRTKYNVL